MFVPNGDARSLDELRQVGRTDNDGHAKNNQEESSDDAQVAKDLENVVGNPLLRHRGISENLKTYDFKCNPDLQSWLVSVCMR